MGVRIRIRRGVVHLVIVTGGKRHEETTGLHISSNSTQNKEVMRMAEVLRSRREIQIIEGLNGISLAATKQTLYKFACTYSDERGHDSQIYKALPYFLRFGADNIQLIAVTSTWFERFQLHMENDSGLSLNTAEKYSSVMRQVLKKATRDGYLRHDPSEGIKHIRTPESIKEYLNAEEVAAMIKTEYGSRMEPALMDDIRRAFIFSCYTGLRVVDMRQLKWKDIDCKKKQIIKLQQKTKKVVSIPLSGPAWALIDDGFRFPDANVFPELARSRTNENRYIKKWAAASGIVKNVTWHTARHTDATMLLECGADLYTVQKLLGHTKISTTEQYAKVTDRRQREAVNALPDYSKID